MVGTECEICSTDKELQNLIKNKRNLNPKNSFLGPQPEISSAWQRMYKVYYFYQKYKLH